MPRSLPLRAASRLRLAKPLRRADLIAFLQRGVVVARVIGEATDV